jgi:phage-related minor tail protein
VAGTNDRTSASIAGSTLITDAQIAGAALKAGGGGAQLGQSSGGIFDLFGSGGTSGFGSDFSFGSFFKDGGAFGPGVQYFANGDVFDSPTAFGFGGGKMGVMGEAGPEAVLPLTRIGGKLGVQSTGGGSTYAPTININISGDATDETVEKFRYVARQELAAAMPGTIQRSVAAVRQEHTRNSNYLKR